MKKIFKCLAAILMVAVCVATSPTLSVHALKADYYAFIVPPVDGEPNILIKGPFYRSWDYSLKTIELIDKYNAYPVPSNGKALNKHREVEKNSYVCDTGLLYTSNMSKPEYDNVPTVLTGPLYDAGYVEIPKSITDYQVLTTFDELHSCFYGKLDVNFFHDNGLPAKNMGHYDAIFFEDAITGETTEIANASGTGSFESYKYPESLGRYKNLDVLRQGHVGNLYVRYTQAYRLVDAVYEDRLTPCISNTCYIRYTVVPIE